ncbi:MAG: sigma-70 family RNA polymerase sigma factor [Clostridia bacterium]|nr:sigma-70 family RNA polymerase sigma factor [Clostridia bacterium]
MTSGTNTATMQLIKEVQNGNEQKMEILLLENEGLIRLVSKRFANRSIEPEDLYQICSIGFIKAVRNFDTSLGLCFSTYAVPTMCGEVKRFLRDDGMVKVSRRLKSLAYAIYQAEEKWEQQYREKPTVSQLAQLLDTTEEEIMLALDATKPTESLYSVVSQGDSAAVYLIDLLENGNHGSEGEYERLLDSESVRSAINTLTPDEQTIIRLRYFKEMSQSKVAEVVGVSQVQISRQEKKIIEKLRNILL